MNSFNGGYELEYLNYGEIVYDVVRIPLSLLRKYGEDFFEMVLELACEKGLEISKYQVNIDASRYEFLIRRDPVAVNKVKIVKMLSLLDKRKDENNENQNP